MGKLLLIDDDDALRRMLCRRLGSDYEVFETGEPEQAVALALEHKPDAILLDLRMPKFDGFELCRNFRSLTYTADIPIFVVTGEAGSFKQECETIGAAGYFEKPIDFAKLKQALSATLAGARTKRTDVTPLRMRVSLRLHGTDSLGEQFTERVATDNVSRDGFQFTCGRGFTEGTVFDVFLTGNTERHVGNARVVERFAVGLETQGYRAIFDGTPDWILQKV